MPLIEFKINIKLYLLILLSCFTIAFELNAQSKLSNPDSLIHYLNKNQHDDAEKINLFNELSSYFYQQEKYVEAIHYKLQQNELLKKTKNDSVLANNNERLALMYYHIGNYELSSKFYLEALKYFELVNNERIVAQISVNLANVYTRIENYKNAISYLYKSKKILESDAFFNERSLAGLYTNIGLAYVGLLQLDSANLYYNKALALINEIENPLYFASILNNKGEVFYELKNYDKALISYEHAYKIFSEIRNYNGMGASKLNIAKLKIKTNEYKSSIKLSKEALENLEEIKSLFFIVVAHQQLYEAYKGLSDYKMANHHLELYLHLKDSLKGNEKTERIANLEMQYATEKEQQKLKILEQQILLTEKENKLKQTRLYIVLGSIIALLIITILTAVYLRATLSKNKLKQVVLMQQQEKLQLTLDFKQKDLESFANYLKEKNQLLENLKKELHSEKNKTPEIVKTINNLTTIINQYLLIDNDRKNLELKIDQEHQEFVKRLQDHYNQLTSNDIRLCSLILLDLNTKEIATILNIEPSSVKMSKNRLRKKLDLAQGENVKTFLNNI